MPKIMIDPGHGGTDPGAVSATGIAESDINLAVALRTAQLLQPIAQIRLTRTDAASLETTKEADLRARAAAANQWNADFFVSIHCNSAPGSQAHGAETFCLALGGYGEQLAHALQYRLVTELGLVDRGVKTANFAVLRETNCPAALAELGFLSYPEEAALLASSEFQDKAARAIALAIADMLDLSLPEPTASLPTVTIVVGNQRIPGVIIGDRAYAPVQTLCQAMGRHADWDPLTRTVTIS